MILTRCISRHEDTQVYGTILPTELTNQAMLESKAYQTYYAFASGEKDPKPKYIRTKADSDTSPKKKPVQATKGTRLKLKAKVAKPDKKKQPVKKTKAKGLAVLSKVALTKAEQLKLATKRSKKDFHLSHASGLGVPDVPPYESESDKESWGDSEDEYDIDDDGDTDDGESDDHDDYSDDERTKSDRDEIPDPNLTNVDQTEYEEEDIDDRVCTPSDHELTDEEKLDDEETMDDEEDDEVIKELYDDVNVNLGNDDTEMTDADQGASEQQNVSQESSSSVSSDLTSKLLNLENPSPDENKIASLMETSARHTTAIPEITSGFTTTTPPLPPFFNPILQQQTPTFTTTTSTYPTVTFLEIPNFAFVFKFDQRVDSTMKTIIKDQVKSQVSKIMPKIEKYVTKSLGAEILIDKIEANKSINRSDNQKNLYNALVESYNFDKDIITSYGDVVLLKRGRDDQDKDEDPFTGSDRQIKRRKSGKDTESSKDSRSKEKKSSITSKDTSQSQHKSSGKSVHAEEPSHTVEDLGMQQDQEFVTGDNDEQPADKEVTKADLFKKPERPPTLDLDWSKRQQVNFRPPQTWISQAALAEDPPTSFDEFNDTSFDFSTFVMNRLKIPNLTQEILVGPAFNLLNKCQSARESITNLQYMLKRCSKVKQLNVLTGITHKTNYLEYLKGGDLSRLYSTSVTKTKAATYELK
ncbi:hypothetical protein Tco_0359416 [Tanacetum coccineum]